MSEAQEVVLEVKLRPAHGDDLATTPLLVLGAAPLILIRMGLEGDALSFDIDATGPETPDLLADLLDLVSSALRNGIPDKEE